SWPKSTPERSRGSPCGAAPRSVANVTRQPARVHTFQGTATSVTSKSRSGSGTRTLVIVRLAGGQHLKQVAVVVGPRPHLTAGIPRRGVACDFRDGQHLAAG